MICPRHMGSFVEIRTMAQQPMRFMTSDRSRFVLFAALQTIAAATPVRMGTHFKSPAD